MRHVWILFFPVLVAGCATHQPAEVQPQPLAVAAIPVSSTKILESRYEVGSYRESASPGIRHEGHAVFRRTRVPNTLNEEAVSRTNSPPASYAPLPASGELAAELGAQKTITADMRAMQASMAETEQLMQAQYATLVRQNAEVLKVRAQWEAERNRVSSTAPSELTAAPTAANAENPAEVKW